MRELRGRHNSPVSTLPELQEPSEPPAVPAQPAKRRAAAQSSDHRPTKQQKTPPPPAAASGNSHLAAAVATAAAAAGRASTSPSAAAAAGPRTRSQGAADAVEELGPNRRSWLQLTFEELHDAEKGVIEGVECVKVWKFGTRQQYEREICVTPSGRFCKVSCIRITQQTVCLFWHQRYDTNQCVGICRSVHAQSCDLVSNCLPPQMLLTSRLEYLDQTCMQDCSFKLPSF